MTTAVHEPSRACYLRGCRRPECCAANNRYLKHYRLDRARTGNRRTDAAPVAKRVRELAAAGWSHQQIADAACCSRRLIAALLDNTYPTIERNLAHRVLNAQPTLATAAPTSYVNATGSIRRTQALIAHGHSLAEVCAAVGMSTGALGRIINHGHPQITARHAKAIADLYEQWKQQPGTNTRARFRAQKAGWRDPQFWDDMGHIDDPTFDPDKPLNRNELGALRRDEILHLARYGYEPETIHQRLNGEVSLSHVRNIVTEHRSGKPRNRGSKQQAVAA